MRRWYWCWDLFYWRPSSRWASNGTSSPARSFATPRPFPVSWPSTTARPYYLGIQQDITSDFHPPQLKHEVLVEGRIAPGPRVCGGIPLQPVSISVLKEVNLACNTLLPAEPGIDAPPAPRGAGTVVATIRRCEREGATSL